MASIGEYLGAVGINISGAGFFWTIFAGISVLILILAIGIWGYFYWMKKQYNVQVVILRDSYKVKKWLPAESDFGMVVGVGRNNEKIIFLRNNKIPVIVEVWFGKQILLAEDEEGNLHNISLGDLNKKLKEVGVDVPNRNMKVAYEALNEFIDRRAQGNKFWKEALPYLVILLALLIFGLILWVVAGKFAAAGQSMATASENWKDATEATQELTAQLDALKDSGTFVKATTTSLIAALVT